MSPPVVLIIGEEDAHVALITDALAQIGIPWFRAQSEEEAHRIARSVQVEIIATLSRPEPRPPPETEAPLDSVA